MKKRDLAILLSALLLLCAAEFLLSNYVRFSASGTEETALSPESASLSGGAIRIGEGIFMRKGSSVSFSGLNVPTAVVAVSGVSASLQAEALTLSASDEGNRYQTRTYVDGRLYTGSTAYFRIVSSGDLLTLRVECTGGEPFTLTGVVINGRPPLRFHFVRVLLIFALFAGLLLVWRKRLWKLFFDPGNRSHRIAALSSLLLCLLVVFLCCAGAGFNRFPVTGTRANVYEQLFFSLTEGRTDLDVDCDPALLDSLEDPYDYTERVRALPNEDAVWDRAYYEGKFYCYFGIAPIFTAFFPVYLLTGGRYIPNMTFAVLLHLLGAVAAMFGLLLALLRYFRLRPPLLPLLFALPVLTFGSMLPVLGVCADMYYLPFASALCFLSAALCFGVRAVLCGKKGRRRALFVLSGVCTALTAASRPTIALYALLLVPFFVGVLAEKGRGRLQKGIDAASYLIPVLVGAFGIMYYNVIRFGSPFEFGASYQMTFSNISYNRLRLDLLGEAFAHYYLQLPRITPLFPYLAPAHFALDSYGTYFFSNASMGALCFPVTWGAAGLGLTTRKQPVKRAFYLSALLVPFFVAFCDLCLGGVVIRYLADILFPTVLLGTLVLLELAGKAVERIGSEGASFRVSLLFGASFCASILLGTALIFANERNWVLSGSPWVFRLAESLFSF